MMKVKTLVALATTLAAAASFPAQALTISSPLGSAATFAAPSVPGGSQTFTFNSGFPASGTNGFTITSTGTVGVKNTTDGSGALPAFSDGSNYLYVTGNSSTTFQSTTGYSWVSFFLGSIDDYNTFDVLNTAGGIIGTFTGSQFTVPNLADGDRVESDTNRRVTISRAGGDPLIGGLRIRSRDNSAELDNLVFAVPEPSTWALMMVGFGMIGLAIRSRARGRKVLFA